MKFDWSQEQQGIILASFYAGYILTHVPGAILVEKIGGKYVLGLGIFISAMLSMVIPIAVQYGKIISRL